MVLIKIFQRNNKALKIFLILFFLFEALYIKAQVYPVQINGSMIGPNSLNLSDYSSLKSQDLMFFITLSDPVEATRMVKLKFSIVNNGQEVIMTSPNYNPIPITLEKDVTVMLDGNDIAGYLNELNLVGLENQQGGGLIPEGYNGFCLEIIDVERNVVISDKFCSYGYFELSDPPILNTPICDEQIMWRESQNFMFNWLPQHFSSANPPMSVEYQFKLVELLPEQTPNDAFQFSIPLYETTTFSTSLFYLEDAPLLEPGKVYAWSVRAFDSQGLNLFNNNGYSQICTFSIMEDNEDETSVPEGNCENGLCDWSGDLSIFPLTSGLSLGDKVDVGFFSMVITEITNASDFYEGTGTIYLPFLHSKLKVSFSNLQINEDQRVFAGDIFSESPENELLIPDLFSIQNTSSYIDAGINLATSFTDQTAIALDQYFNDPASNLVSTLSSIPEQSTIPITVPIGMDLSSENDQESFTIAVTGVKFTANKAVLNAVMSTRLANNSPWIKFGAKDFCIQPQGLAQSGVSKLNLLTDLELDFNGMPITFLGTTLASEGSYVSWNCDGFEEFFIDGQYTFDNNKYINLSNVNDPLIASFTTSTKQLDDIIIKINALDDFSIVGAEDFSFNIANTKIDLSIARNIVDITFPEDDSYNNADDSWTGFYIENINLTIPEQLRLGGNKTAMSGHHLLIDQLGVSGTVGVTDFLSASTSAMGDWEFTVDNLGVEFLKSKFVKASLDGIIDLPLIDDGFNYFGDIQPVPNSSIWRMNLGPVGTQELNIDALKASVEVGEESIITVDMDPNVDMSDWVPYADLSGSFNLNIGEADFENPNFAGVGLFDVLVNIEDILGIDMAFNPPSFAFHGFKINHPDLPTGIKYGIDNIDANFNFNIVGINFGIDDVDFIEVPSISLDPISFPDVGGPNVNPIPLPALGFKFKIGALGINFDVDFWSKKLPNVGYTFGKIDMDYDPFSFSCSAQPAAATSNLNPGNTILAGSSFNAGGFTIQVDAVNANKGTIAFPFIPNSDFHVSLEGVIVNTNNKMIGGNISADKEISLFQVDPVTFGPNLLPIDVPIIEDIQGVTIDFSQNLDLLPFSLTSKIEEVASIDLPFDFLLSGIDFTPNGAALDVVLAVDMGDKKLMFGAKGLALSPNGVNLGQIKFYLLNPIDLEMNGWNLSILPKTDQGDSYVTLSCQGLEDFSLNARYNFSDKFVNENNPADGVYADIILAGDDWGEFIGTTNISAPFHIDGFNDFVFTLSKASIDLSSDSNIADIVFPDDDSYSNADDSWTGFYIEDINLTIPEQLRLGGNKTAVSGHHLLIDQLGVSGTVGVTDFLSASTSAMGDWEFTVDNLGVEFLKSKFVKASLDGIIDLPLIDDGFNYFGDIQPVPNSSIWRMNLGPVGTQELNIDALKASVEVGEESIITVDMDPNVDMSDWVPYADLSGSFNLNIGEADFENPNFAGVGLFDVLVNIEDILGIDMAFNPPSFAFHGFKINHPDLPTGIKYGIDNIDANFNFNIVGINFGIDDVDFIEVPSISLDPISFPDVGGPNVNPIPLPALGFKFKIGALGINFDVDFWSKKLPNVGYTFGKIDMDYDPFSFSCSAQPAAATSNLNPGNTILAGSSFNAGGFTIQVDAVNANKGTIAFPFIPNSDFHVSLEGVIVNTNNKMIGGNISADKEISLFQVDPVTFGPNLLPIDVPIIEDIQGVTIDFSQNLDLLPFSLTSKIEEVASIDLPFDFLLSGIDFTPNGAALDVVLAVDMGDKKLMFGAKGLALSPNGVNLGQIKFYLLNPIDLEMNGWNLSILPKTDQGDSYVTLSCQGLEDFSLNARYNFSDKFVNENNPADGVYADIILAGDDWGEFIGTTNISAPFHIDGFNDFVFTLSKASIDLSSDSNIADIVFPDDDSYSNADDSWTGFYIEDINLTIPEQLRLGGNKTAVSGHHLLIDQLGVSGTVGVTDFLSADQESNAFGNWAFSIDTFEVNFITSVFDSAYIEGAIRLPLLSEDILYEGGFTIENSNYLGSLKPRHDMKVGMGFGPQPDMVAMTVEKESIINLSYNDGIFKPSAVLCGKIDLHIDKAHFPQEIQEGISLIESKLPNNARFRVDAEFNMCIGIDPVLTFDDRRMYELISYNGSITLPGLGSFSLENALSLFQMDLDYSMSNIVFPDRPQIPNITIPGFPNFDMSGFPYIKIPGLPGFSLPDFKINLPTIFPSPLPDPFIPLGFSFHLPALPGISLDIGCWAIAIPDVNVDVPDFDFAMFSVRMDRPEFSCVPDPAKQFSSIENGNIYVPFLSRSFDVTSEDGISYSTASTDDYFENKSLKQLISSLSLPPEITPDIPEDYTFKLTGLTFDSYTAYINLELLLDGISFKGSLPIHLDGINFNGFKFGPGQDIDLRN